MTRMVKLVKDQGMTRSEVLKHKAKEMKRFSHLTLDHRPRQFLFLNQRGAPSVINFPNYFSGKEFCHLKTQQAGRPFRMNLKTY
jgi:hypothetical protein